MPRFPTHACGSSRVDHDSQYPLQLAFYKDYPPARILKLVGVQAVLDHMQGAKKVHLIDRVIRSGVNWIILMQALVLHPVELLKITVVAQTEWKDKMEDIRKPLASFAYSLHLNFFFQNSPGGGHSGPRPGPV